MLENNDVVTLIEFDGRQHYQSVDRFGGDVALNVTKVRDKVKTDYCIKNNIPLIRIPYWEFNNISKILGKRLYKLGLIK